jgi:hypothetical protein
MTSAVFVRDVLCDRIDSVALLRFDGNSYSRRRNTGLITFFHRTNYGKFELLNFNYYCDFFGFRSEDSRVVFRDKLKSDLLEERSRRLRLL